MKNTYPASQPMYGALDVDAEGSPLLSGPASGRAAQGWAHPAGPHSFKETPAGQWRFPWFQFWGDCSPSDITACGVSHSCSLCAWAWNQDRALALPFWTELSRLLLLVLLGLVFYIPVTLLSTPQDEAGDMPPPRPVLSFFLSLGLLCVWLFTVYFLAIRRTAIRERFGIDGTFWGDFCLWCCCKCCALSQETRTLWHEQVHGGVCYGPLPGVHPPAHAAPMPQQFV